MLGYERPIGIKRLLPQSLFGRAFMILVVPTVLVQLMAVYVFYERHWDNVSRWMAGSLAGEIALMVHELNGAPPEKQKELMLLAHRLMAIKVTLEPSTGTEKFIRTGRDVSPIFYDELQAHLNLPFSLRFMDKDRLEIRIKQNEDLITAKVSRKRIVSATTNIFVWWMFSSAAVLTAVAVLFLRNQIRPIGKLATAMEEFGKGHGEQGFRPRGALEVRRVGYAFLQMKQRIERQISARMEMLAGISHDLRTPLTRMKLQVELLALNDAKTAEDLNRDVADMEYMIGEYLDFVRGEGQETPESINLQDFMEDVLTRYSGQEVSLQREENSQVTLDLRPHAFRRAVTNIIDNALRYGKECRISLRPKRGFVDIRFDDSGPGIPKEKYEEVFKPFKRLDQSRNSKTGGVGLGLTIARDIILAHGGEATLHSSPLGGLRVLIKMPVA